MTDNATTDVVPAGVTVTGADLVVPQFPTSEVLKYAVRNAYNLTVEGEGDESTFLLRTLEATGEDAILGADQGTLTKMDDILGVVVKIVSYDGLRNSTYSEGWGVWAVITVADKDGQTYTLAVGSKDAICKVVKLSEENAIPSGWVVFEKSTKPTKGGYYPINLVKVSTDSQPF